MPASTDRIACIHMPHMAASVAMRDDVALSGRPLVIASPEPGAEPGASSDASADPDAEPVPRSDRATVYDLSYPAHMSGVSRGMPIRQAKRLCPGLVVLPARSADYRDIFQVMLDALGQVSPEIEPAGLSQSWLSTRGLIPAGGREAALAEDAATRVRKATGLNVRVGLAHGKLTSRIITRYLQARDVMVLPPGKEVAFLGGLSTRYLPLTPKTLDQLRGLGLGRIHQYAELPPRGILPRFGYPGLRAYELAHGQDEQRLKPWSEEPWLTAAHSFPDPIANLRSLKHHVARLARQLADPLAQRYQMAACLRLSVAFDDGQAVEPGRDLLEPIGSARALAAQAEALMAQVQWQAPVERIALAVRGLCPTVGRQLALWKSERERREGIQEAIGRIQARYGEACIGQVQVIELEAPLHDRRAAYVPLSDPAQGGDRPLRRAG